MGFVPLDDPERSIACLEEALDLGIAAAWVPHGVPAEKSPTHPDYDGLWARLAEARIPMLFHFGGNGGTQMARAYHNNGRDPGKDFVGGGESVRSKDFLNIFHDAENLLACLVLDGTFEQFPELRCGVIELGAGWVPNLLRSLDHAVRAFGRNEPELAKLRLAPSDYIRRQVRFTPWHFEDVGELIDLPAGPTCSCSPPTGPTPRAGATRWPSSARRSTAPAIGPAARHRFYYQNLADLLGVPA